MCTFTTRVVVDDGTEFSPSVELCVEDGRSGRTRLVAVSGQMMSHADIEEMAAMLIDELRQWEREAKGKLDEAQALAFGGAVGSVRQLTPAPAPRLGPQRFAAAASPP